ncbi:hypothetical protein FDA94_00135 [Herbidospora galbida]|uniref:Uncharacterized protein n=1 Tax=Herbidospora galbida TaxID=2575442 RepID=A0A4V5V070_9ACTN|nr:IS3 family transposase [Herbidospora galbida]TKK91263.1 hypothetical protein FDA94_00135 [Herbidospora galbida]
MPVVEHQVGSALPADRSRPERAPRVRQRTIWLEADLRKEPAFAWRSPPSPRSLRHAWLSERTRQIHAASRGTYGSRRVYAELKLGGGLIVAYHTVEMLMQREGIRGLPGNPRGRRPVQQVPTAADMVDRDFHRDAPNMLWVTDITEHPTREGKVYCCVVLDVYSRRVVVVHRLHPDLGTGHWA